MLALPHPGRTVLGALEGQTVDLLDIHKLAAVVRVGYAHGARHTGRVNLSPVLLARVLHLHAGERVGLARPRNIRYHGLEVIVYNADDLLQRGAVRDFINPTVSPALAGLFLPLARGR